MCDRPRVRVGKRAEQDTNVGEGKYLWMREVRVQREDGRQTPILTNRQDLTVVEVAYRMFNRWRQENYFKYMGEEFALDALVEYGADEVAEGTDRRNPAWLALTRRLKKAKAAVTALRTELGEAAAANVEAQRPTMRGFKIAHAELRGKLDKAEARVERLIQQRQGDPEAHPRQRPGGIEDGEEADRGCDQNGRLPSGDGVVGHARRALRKDGRRGPDVASRRVQVACTAGGGRGGVTRDDRLTVLAPSHGGAAGLMHAT